MTLNSFCNRFIVATLALFHAHVWAAAFPLTMFEGNKIRDRFGAACAVSEECLHPFYISLPGKPQFYATILVYNNAPMIFKKTLSDGHIITFSDPDAAAQIAIGILACEDEKVLEQGAHELITFLESTKNPFHKYKSKIWYIHNNKKSKEFPITGSIGFPHGRDCVYKGSFLMLPQYKDLYNKVRATKIDDGAIAPDDFDALVQRYAQTDEPCVQVPVIGVDVQKVADLVAKLQYLPRCVEDY